MASHFIKIKSHLLAQIEDGSMQRGDKVPSENKLAEQFNVSRMTARRALTELVNEGILFRSQGLGTFVNDQRPMSSMLKIISIDDEVLTRGHSYTNRVIFQKQILANAHQAHTLGLETNDAIYQTQIIHLENNTPIQLEDRLVNPNYAGGYIEQDFTKITANRYLNKVAPLTEAEHFVEALLPPTKVAHALSISPQQPCLLVSRRTFSAKGIVSFANLYHPGNRYRLGGHLDFPTANCEK
ncbi:histidine utilization repressor [Aliiglaciecola sp. 3_MG-2023]|uniref:histidine utilization repressor n=1 Tax=Aliiglaciecola sp. 3_MG-2023 TaxID=3062644 RepID=UPI0026E4018F|nr:histidine utilization repressor [Aliiglaciecola sp. 3_MG-2023]MDO6692609.1 histidine utilization repressor [Aliiglaciecola sp. 3_MG-2023]